MDPIVRAYKELESFQTLSLYQDNLFAASYASNQILIGNIDNELNEILTISPKSSSGSYSITGSIAFKQIMKYYSL